MDPYDRGRRQGLGKENLRRVIGATQRNEDAYRNAPPPGRVARVWQMSGTKCAISGSGGITAASGSTPGSGTVTLYDFDGTTLTAESATVTAYNNMSSAVAGSLNIKVTWVDGYWFVINVDC